MGLKYKIDTNENRDFMNSMTQELLRFGERFPSPEGSSYYLGDDAANYKTVWENEELEPIGFCVKKGNDELSAKLEEAIDALYADGTLASIAEKYFGTDLTAGLR